MIPIGTRIHLLILSVLCLLGIASDAIAADGVIEINAINAATGGVTPGDAPGLPVTLTKGGSYILTSNLTLAANQTGIVINTDHVTIDLNGFAIKGPETCSPIGPSVTLVCTLGGGNHGIFAANRTNIAIRNGEVSGVTGHGIYLAPSTLTLIENVVTTNNSLSGIYVHEAAIVDGAFSWRNGENGIRVYRASIVRGSVVAYSGHIGIVGDRGNVIVRNRIEESDTRGISTLDGSVVAENVIARNGRESLHPGVTATRSSLVRNTLFDNWGIGLTLTQSGYGNNTLIMNNGSDANPQVSGGIEIGTNVCGGDTTCP